MTASTCIRILKLEIDFQKIISGLWPLELELAGWLALSERAAASGLAVGGMSQVLAAVEALVQHGEECHDLLVAVLSAPLLPDAGSALHALLIEDQSWIMRPNAEVAAVLDAVQMLLLPGRWTPTGCEMYQSCKQYVVWPLLSRGGSSGDLEVMLQAARCASSQPPAQDTRAAVLTPFVAPGACARSPSRPSSWVCCSHLALQAWALLPAASKLPKMSASFRREARLHSQPSSVTMAAHGTAAQSSA